MGAVVEALVHGGYALALGTTVEVSDPVTTTSGIGGADSGPSAGLVVQAGDERFAGGLSGRVTRVGATVVLDAGDVEPRPDAAPTLSLAGARVDVLARGELRGPWTVTPYVAVAAGPSWLVVDVALDDSRGRAVAVAVAGVAEVGVRARLGAARLNLQIDGTRVDHGLLPLDPPAIVRDHAGELAVRGGFGVGF